MGKIILGDEENAGSFLVEAMNDARTKRIVGLGEVEAATKQGIDQRAVGIPCPSVNGHARGLVDADHVVVLVEDVERNGFGLGLKRRTRLGVDLNDVAGTNLLGILGGFSIQEDQALFDEFLDASTGEINAMGSDDTVEAETGLGFVDGNGELRGVGHLESVAREQQKNA